MRASIDSIRIAFEVGQKLALTAPLMPEAAFSVLACLASPAVLSKKVKVKRTPENDAKCKDITDPQCHSDDEVIDSSLAVTLSYGRNHSGLICSASCS